MNATANQETVILTAEERKPGKPRYLRQEGIIPLELYGNGEKNRNLQADHKKVTQILRDYGTTTLIDLVVGKDKPIKVLLREKQLHPVTHSILHLDLYQVNLKEKITSEIPLVFTGQSAAIDDLGGTLIETKNHVEVECLPQDLPHELSVDITKLKTFEDVLHVKDIITPTGVEILDETEDVIASVTEPRSEEELAALDEAIEEDIEGVEVDEKSQEDAEAEEGAEGAEGAEASADSGQSDKGENADKGE